MNIEQAAEVIDRNVMPHVSNRLKRGLKSGESDADLAKLMDRLAYNLRPAASLSGADDARIARQPAAESVAFRRAEGATVTAHFDIMRADLLRDLKLINSLIVAAAAYPVLDGGGELLVPIAVPG